MRSFDGLRERRKAEANARYLAHLAGGFPLADYPGETLQCLTDRDRTNLLWVQKKCEKANALGVGDMQIPEPGLRCTSNRHIRPTVAETLAILEGCGTWAEAAQANNWKHKDAIRDMEAVTSADAARFLQAIDLDAGWS
jgi:hypothetical protein